MFKVTCLIAVLSTFTPVLAQPVTVELNPVADTSLFEASPTASNVSNGGGAWLHVGLTNSWGERRPLLRFNLSALPTNARVTSARLRVNIDRQSGGGAVPLRVFLARVQSSWLPGTVNTGGAEGTGAQAQEGDATWNYRSYSAVPANAIPWAPGGDLGTPNIANVTMGSSLGDVTFPSTTAFVALVQSWVTSPQTNYGIALVPQAIQTGVARRLRSSESATSQPVLTVTYTVPPPCDIDFNNDSLFPSDDDLVELLTVLAGGPCSTEPPAGVGCDDIDINNDGLFPSDEDLVAFLSALAGGSC